MTEILGVSLESLAPSIPLVALIGLYFSLDKLAGKESDVGAEYQSLLDQALEEREKATRRAVREWPSVGDPNTDFTLTDLSRALWQRLSEIEDKERELRSAMERYRSVRSSIRYAIGLGGLVCVTGFFWNAARLPLIAVATVVFIVAFLAGLYARHTESKIDAFGDQALFRR